MELREGVALDLISVSSELRQTKSALLVAHHGISDICGFRAVRFTAPNVLTARRW